MPGPTWSPAPTPAGEVLSIEHGPEGTLMEARVPPDLAAEARACSTVVPESAVG